MESVIYISSAREIVDGPVLDAVLVASRRNNARDGLTGLLVFDGVRFLQYIEGERWQLDITLDRIAADPRHRAMVVLGRQTRATRQFGDWAMACRRTMGTETLADAVTALTADCDATTQAELVSFARFREAA